MTKKRLLPDVAAVHNQREVRKVANRAKHKKMVDEYVQAVVSGWYNGKRKAPGFGAKTLNRLVTQKIRKQLRGAERKYETDIDERIMMKTKSVSGIADAVRLYPYYSEARNNNIPIGDRIKQWVRDNGVVDGYRLLKRPLTEYFGALLKKSQDHFEKQGWTVSYKLLIYHSLHRSPLYLKAKITLYIREIVPSSSSGSSFSSGSSSSIISTVLLDSSDSMNSMSSSDPSDSSDSSGLIDSSSSVDSHHRGYTADL